VTRDVTHGESASVLNRMVQVSAPGDQIGGRGERDSPSLTQRSLSFLMVNATPRESPAPLELVRSA